MALHRGIQSAIFYYLSCAPYFEAQTRRKRKQEAKRDRAAREVLEGDLPDLYRHPSPSSTNPYWQAEIDLGPTLHTRGKRKPNTAERKRSRRRPDTSSSDHSGLVSTEDLRQKSDHEHRNDSSLNFRPYQREDEELWGSTTFLDRSSCGDSIRRPPTARTKDSTRSDFKNFRHPPINDLHPATVTRVASREDVMWMMQPPPVAEVMNGSLRAPRSRSNSGASRPGSSHPSLMRQTSNRYDPSRLRGIGITHNGISRETLHPDSHRDLSDEKSGTSEHDFAMSVTSPAPQERVRPPPLLVPEHPNHSVTGVAHELLPVEEQSLSGPDLKYASRPPLETITSRDEVPSISDEPSRETGNLLSTPPPVTRNSSYSYSPRAHITQHSAILVHEKSLRLVQDLQPGPGGVLNTKIIAATTPSSPTQAVHRLSPVDSADHSGTSSAISAQPEMFESWYTPDFKLPDWVHEYTQREVQQRWSMDF